MLINSPEKLKEVLEKLILQTVFVVDIEASGLDILGVDELCGIGVGTANNENYYFSFRHKEGENLDIKYLKYILKLLEGKIIIGQNVKYDIKGLYKEGFNYKNCILIDLPVMGRLCSDERYPSLSLDSLITKYLGVEDSYKKDFKKSQGRGKKKKRVDELNSSDVGEYCCNDLKYELDIYRVLEKIILRTKQQDVWKQEIKMTKTLLNVEINGVKIDLEYCKNCVQELGSKLSSLEQEIYSMVGVEFNINSSKQLTEAFNSMGIHSPVKNKTGESWNQRVMTKLEHPVAKKISEYRSVSTLKNTFFEPQLENNKEIIHTDFRNWKAVTGRLSCSNPNLQNIPKKTRYLGEEDLESKLLDNEILKNMISTGTGGFGAASGMAIGDEGYSEGAGVAARRLFVPREDYYMFAIDVNQMEYVVFLYYSEEFEIVKKMAEEGLDFHAWVAIEALGADPNDENFVYMRQIAKGINFAIIYGMGLNSLAINIGKSQEEAQAFREKYFERIPKGLKFIFKMREKVESGDPVYNDYGRRYLINPGESYKIINYLCQGTAGEIIKENMINIEKILKNHKSRMLIQIHDELLFEIHKNELNLLEQIVGEFRKNKLNLPMGVDIKWCNGSWANGKKLNLKEAMCLDEI